MPALTPEQEALKQAALEFINKRATSFCEVSEMLADYQRHANPNAILVLLAQLEAQPSEDAERIDWLERRGNERGGLLLHAGNEESGGRCGLGLKNTGRTLRQACDSAAGKSRVTAKTGTKA